MPPCDPVGDRHAVDFRHEREVGELVVEEEASRRHQAASELVLDRGRHGDRIAVAVDDRDVRRRRQLERGIGGLARLFRAPAGCPAPRAGASRPGGSSDARSRRYASSSNPGGRRVERRVGLVHRAIRERETPGFAHEVHGEERRGRQARPCRSARASSASAARRCPLTRATETRTRGTRGKRRTRARARRRRKTQDRAA